MTVILMILTVYVTEQGVFCSAPDSRYWAMDTSIFKRKKLQKIKRRNLYIYIYIYIYIFLQCITL